MRFALLLLLIGANARATPLHTIRLASAAPDGTAWAREFKAFSRDVETSTHGEVVIKWYLGGIAGDEVTVGERITRGQLDGTASGGGLCTKLSLTMRAMRLSGLFQNAAEVTHIMSRMRVPITKEFAAAGLRFVTGPYVGGDLVFTRTPVRSMADLQKIRLWRWDIDDVGVAVSKAMSIPVVAKPLELGLHAYDAHEMDGFLAVPAAALAFQWSANTRYLTPLTSGYLAGCLLISEKSFAKLGVEHQRAVLSAGAKAVTRVDQVTRMMDEMLVGGLFQKQGMKVVEVSPAFRAAFNEAAQKASVQVAEAFGAKDIVAEIQKMLVEFRAEKPAAGK
jgi:TRAP-type transport system periplasmic protein